MPNNTVPKRIIEAIIFGWDDVLYDRERNCLFPDSEIRLKQLNEHYLLGLVTIVGEDNIGVRVKEIESSGVEDLFDSVVYSERKGRFEYEECMDELGVYPRITAVVDSLPKWVEIGK